LNGQPFDENLQIKNQTFDANAKLFLKSVHPENLDDLPKRKREINYLSIYGQEKPFDRVSAQEVVLSVAIFHPSDKTKKTQEFLVLGSQSLFELRDCFYCLNDHILENAISKSGCFFIENVFYDDMRDPEAIHYSKDIIQWCDQDERYTQPGLGIYSRKNMEDVTFNELSIRIATPYHYIHRGDCVHTICFTQLRLLNEDDNKNRNQYPIHTFQQKIRWKKCSICEIYSCRNVTFNDPFGEGNPTFFCDQCYRPLHYDISGKLLYRDFEVYPYWHE